MAGALTVVALLIDQSLHGRDRRSVLWTNGLTARLTLDRALEPESAIADAKGAAAGRAIR